MRRRRRRRRRMTKVEEAEADYLIQVRVRWPNGLTTSLGTGPSRGLLGAASGPSWISLVLGLSEGPSHRPKSAGAEFFPGRAAKPLIL
eukprot:5627855-Pyramimonas_sp.AAC.1